MEHQEWIDLAMKVGVHLHLQMQTICTACQYLHRFAARKKVADYDRSMVVCTALFTSSKSNENHVRLSELISSTQWHVANEADKAADYDQFKILENNEEYWKLRASVIDFEQHMVRVLRFEFNIDLPHKYQIFYLKTLSDWLSDKQVAEELFQLAWSVLNDYVCKRILNTQFPLTFVALISIDIALNIIDKSRNIKKRKHLEGQWYTHFDKSLTTDMADEIKTAILDVYSNK